MKPLPHAVTPSRRAFLQTAAAAAGVAAAGSTFAAPAPALARRCILINLVGGPSQLDTFDPKPNAPADIRGPFRPIATSVPGLFVSELFPRLARQMDQVALVRSVFHDEAPIHETGQQLVQTGRLAEPGAEAPHVGALAGRGQRSVGGLPSFIVVPGPIRNTGVSMSHGQSAGAVPPAYRDLDAVRGALNLNDLPRYGDTQVGRGCLAARLLAEQGARFIAVNMFDTVFDELTWDCHADGGSLRATLTDVRDHVAPQLDLAFTALLTDLKDRGLLESTLVVATGEFGRTPKINRRGGRDHWPSVWTALFAGGGVRGGQAIGASDALGAAPADRPVPAAALAGTMLHALGLPMSEATAEPPIFELF